MTLRFKILAAIVLVMTLIFSLLTLNLWLESYNRIRAEKQTVGELLARITQDWVTKSYEDRTKSPTTEEQLAAIAERLRYSTLFDQWLIVDSQCNPIESNQPWRLALPLENVNDMTEALSTGRPVIRKLEVSAPLLFASGQKIGIRMNVRPDLLTSADPARQFSAVLIIMGMGTVLLILTMYVLLNRFVMRPLERLVAASSHVEAGDYAKEIPESSRYDEIEHLNRAFNQMMRSIRSYSTTMELRIAEATEQIKRTERGLIVAQRLSAMGTLAAGIAHEINNPLGGMLNAARALQKSNVSKERHEEYLELIVEGLGRIERTVKKILGFVPRKVDMQPVELSTVVEKALALDEHRLKRKRISVSNRCLNKATRVLGDSTELQQAVFNVIKNAVDATGDDGCGVIDIDLETSVSEAVLSIADNGAGMDEEQMSNAFDPFYTTKAEEEGTGLGLTIAHQIVTSHGGRIELESRSGTGTRVRIVLPLSPEYRRVRE
jgi:signal transduction histidine kinase